MMRIVFTFALMVGFLNCALAQQQTSDSGEMDKLVLRMASLASLKELELLEKTLLAHPDLINRSYGSVNEGNTVLFMVADRNDSLAIELLMAHGADPKLPNSMEANQTPFTHAARQGHVASLDEFVRLKVDINHQNPSAETSKYDLPMSALDQASLFGRHEAVAFLLDHEAKLDSNPVGVPYPALHYAMYGYSEFLAVHADADFLKHNPKPPTIDNSDVIELLLAKGASLSSHNQYGDQALHVAIKHTASFTVKYLLDHHRNEIDIDAPGSGGYTPLTLAATHSASDELTPRSKAHNEPPEMIVRLLLEHGADKNKAWIPDDMGGPESAYQLARKSKADRHVLELLKP